MKFCCDWWNMVKNTELLNSNFSIHQYNGGFEIENCPIDNILIHGKYHYSKPGKNKALCLKYNGSKFTLTNISLLGPNNGATAPIKTALLWVSSSPISIETMEKFKDFKESDFKNYKITSEEDPILFMETNPKNYEFIYDFKDKFPVGSYIGILFISTYGLGSNIDVETLGLVGFNKEIKEYFNVGSIPDEFQVTRKKLKLINNFTIELFDYLEDQDKINFFLFTKNQNEVDELKKITESGDFKEFNYFYIDPDEKLAKNLMESLGIIETPCATIFSYDLSQKYGTFDVSLIGLNQFIKDYKDGKAKKLVKSEKRPLNDQDPKNQDLIIVTADSFKEIVLNDQNDVFLYVYSDYCMSCKSIYSIITILAQSFYLEGITNILIAKLNIDNNDIDSNYIKESNKSLPILKLFKSGEKDYSLSYQGQRTPNGILTFIHDNSKNKFDKEKVESHFESLQKNFERLEKGNVKKFHSKQEFEDQLKDLKKEQLCVIDFFADWCGPCHMIAPKFVELSLDYPDILFLKVDVDEIPELTDEYNIIALPTFIFFKDSKIVHSFDGIDFETLKNEIGHWK